MPHCMSTYAESSLLTPFPGQVVRLLYGGTPWHAALAAASAAAGRSCATQSAGTSPSSHSHTLQSRSMHMPSSGQKGQSQYRLTLK